MATRLIEIGGIDIEAIKDQYPLASIVEQHVALQGRPGKQKGLCPFHDERSPSFHIFEKDQRYHCFGCGAHGDVFDFLQHMEGLDLRAAAERLTGGSFPVYSADRIEEIRMKRLRMESEERQAQEAATNMARELWLGAEHTFDDHPYLASKGITLNGTRLRDGYLLVPVFGVDAKIQSLQSIDATGRKQFYPGAPMSGGFFVIGGKVATTMGPVILAEGFATAASIHEATGEVVVCAFTSGNLKPVAELLIAKYPDKKYILAGDDDRGKEVNTGREKGIEAAAILHCQVVFPDFLPGSSGTDFNDMAQEVGKPAIRDLIIEGKLPSGESAPETPRLIMATPFKWRSEAAIPPRKWLYGKHLLRKFLSVDVAAGGVGKSSVKIGEALAMASGKPLYNKDIHDGPLTVWLYNLEDPAEETERRIHATAKRFCLKPEEFGDRLYADSGRDQPCVIATEGPNGTMIASPVVEAVIGEIMARKVDVLIIDPFVSSHEVSENDNKAMDKVAKEWGRIADICNCSINLVHHIKKLNGTEATAESARGAISLIAAARSVLVYNRMSKDEAEKAGLPEGEASFIFRTTNDKANLSPPEKADWYRMNNVNLANGDEVGVACPWDWPDVFANITTSHLVSAQKAVGMGDWRESSQSEQWVGHAIAPVLDMNIDHPGDRKRLLTIIREWVKNGVLEVVEKKDAKSNLRKFVVVGRWVTT